MRSPVYSSLNPTVQPSKLQLQKTLPRSVFLKTPVAGFSVPSLQDVDIRPLDLRWPPIVYPPRFINELEEHYHAAHLAFQAWAFRFALLTHLDSKLLGLQDVLQIIFWSKSLHSSH
jgi:hypothetical protein